MTTNTSTPSTQRIALVTGGNRGLGREEVLALAADGTDILLTWRSDQAEASAVVAEVERLGRVAVALRLDTSDHDSFPAFVDTVVGTLRGTWGRDTFDVLVNNAGHMDETVLGSITKEH
ncbi:MAG: SDR family NAD(P)-dependent oxidoreductase, partial [Dermatophilaceae bacterium]